jgi:hypothetical protein
VIPPGQVGYLTATLKTTRLRGKVGKGISVYSNDTDKPSVRLTIRAVVLGSVVVLPREQLVIGGPAGRIGGSRVLVRQDPLETGKLEITDLETTSPWLSATARRLEEPTPPGEGLPKGQIGDWLVEVAIDDSGRTSTGRTRDELRFKTGLKRQPEVSIPITVDLRPPVNLSVPRLVLIPPAEGEVASKTVMATVRRGLEANALKVETGNPALEAKLDLVGPRRYEVHFTWNGEELGDASVLFRVGSESHRLPVKVAPAGFSKGKRPTPTTR